MAARLKDTEEVLTPREQEVMELIGKWGSNVRMIAANIGIKLTTVKTYLNNIYAKYNVQSKIGAVIKHYQKTGECVVCARDHNE